MGLGRQSAEQDQEAAYGQLRDLDGVEVVLAGEVSLDGRPVR
ncbi:hypothetical protein [Streptomyces sp. NPDC058621]